jgi:3-isopropylmalate dehydrogenase
MEKYHNVATILGDLNGRTVTYAALKVAEAASSMLTKPIKHTEFPYGADYFLEKGITELGKDELNELAKYEEIFKGPVGDPTKIKPGILEVGIILKIRQEFDQYVNRRPIILPEGVPSVIVGKTHEDINFEIIRENSEGLYAGIGWIENKGKETEAAYQVMKCTYKGVKRLAEFADQLALERKKSDKPTMHFVFKTNVLTYAASPWNRVFVEYSKREDIVARYMHIDNFVMQMVQTPEQFDVVIGENMFMDIATDLGAMIQGGIGTGVSGNLNPTRKYPSMFEPIHGSAPDKWYEMDRNGKYIPNTYLPHMVQKVKPEAAILAYSMMLETMGETMAAKLMKDAALNNIRDPRYKSKSLDELVDQACNFVRKKD